MRRFEGWWGVATRVAAVPATDVEAGAIDCSRGRRGAVYSGLAALVVLTAGWASPLSARAQGGVGAARAPAGVPILFGGNRDLEAVNADGSGRRVVLAAAGPHDEPVAADQTADGARIVYVNLHDAQDAGNQLVLTETLRVANADGSGDAPLGRRAVYGTGPRWSPDGERIVFDVTVPNPNSRPNPTIAVIGADGSNQTTIGPGSSPDWSPDGQRLVYQLNNQLLVSDARPDAAPVAIAALDVYPNSGGARWSPDGTVIAFTRAGGTVSVVHPDGSGLRDVGSDPLGGVVGWSPDSRNLAVVYGQALDFPALSWTDPSTGATHDIYPTEGGSAWAKASGPVPCPDGYWLVGRDGGVFSFGTAGFHGSTGGMGLNRPVVGMGSTPGHRGYWLVAADGGVFSFGDAAFHGSTGNLHLNRAIIGVAASTTGSGYILAAADGGTFTFGDARFPGSAASPGLPAPVTASAGIGRGLLLATSNGEIAAMDDARWCGSLRGVRLAAPIVAASAA